MHGYVSGIYVHAPQCTMYIQCLSFAGFAKCLSLLYLDLSSNLIAEVCCGPIPCHCVLHALIIYIIVLCIAAITTFSVLKHHVILYCVCFTVCVEYCIYMCIHECFILCVGVYMQVSEVGHLVGLPDDQPLIPLIRDFVE